MQRKTIQRQAIQHVIESSDHPLSLQEILERAQENVEGMGIATVYRELKRLTDEHAIAQVQLPHDIARYEKSGKSHHHHFKCRVCGNVFDIEGCLGNIATIIPQGFTHESHEITIFGKCAGCG